jgi:V/A-type H+-transporting ATPase subunit I
MRWRERLRPEPMSRVAMVALDDQLRDALVAAAEAGTAELEASDVGVDERLHEALRRTAQRSGGVAHALLAERRPDIARLEREGRRDLLAGETELDRRAAACIHRSGAALTVGWVPRRDVVALSKQLAAVDAALVELPAPRWVEPPTLLRPAPGARSFQPVVATYGTVRYADLDPTLFAAVAYVLMFGMMFGDVGHGLLLACGGLWLLGTRRPALAKAHRVWPVVVAAGLTAAGFGLLYGEAFGPSGLVPTLWLDPLDQPARLLLAGVAVGGVLLVISQLLGTVNRWRESGPAEAAVSASGVAGLVLLAAIGTAAAAFALGSRPLSVVALGVATLGVLLLAVGLLRRARDGAAVAEAAVELVDAVVRLGTNALSFARLAAFGLMHAAIGLVVWQGTTALFGGVAGTVAAVALFAAGNLLAFSLEALVAGVQALRLEYYELFSRIFAGEGRPFSPWRLPVVVDGATLTEKAS